MTERESDTSAFEAAAEEVKGQVPETDLRTISRLGARQVELEGEVADLEAKLKAKKRDLLQVSQVDLPEAMAAAGFAEFRLSTGERVKVEEGVDANIKAANRERAHAWLDKHGFGDLVKRQVTANLGRDSDELLKRLGEVLGELEVPYETKEQVHPQTLKAFVREQLGQGVELPRDLFGIFEYKRTKVERPKQ